MNHPAVLAEVAAGRKHVVDRRRSHLCNDRQRFVGAGIFDRLQIVAYRRICAGLNCRRHCVYTVEEALRPSLCLRRSLWMECHQPEVALSEFKPDRLDLVDHELHRNYAYAWLRQVKLRRLLEQVNRVGASGPKRDHGRIALLCLQQEGAEIGGSEWSSHVADNRAAELLDRRNAVTLHRMPEGEV